MLPSYEVRVLGPLPAEVLSALRAVTSGSAEARTVLHPVAADPATLTAALARLAALGLEVFEVRWGPRRAELEVRGILGPALQAALADVLVSDPRWRCVLCLRLPGRCPAEVVQALNEYGVDLVSIRRVPAGVPVKENRGSPRSAGTPGVA
jgi:hypothetical protein